MISRVLAATTVLLLAVAASGQQREAPRVVAVKPAVVPAPAKSAPIISLSVKDADLVEVIRSLARIAGVNLIIDPGVEGKVTAELIDVRWDHALAVILKTQGLAMELDGRILTVAPPRRLMETR
jgi:type II secretory pathway component HofQ